MKTRDRLSLQHEITQNFPKSPPYFAEVTPDEYGDAIEVRASLGNMSWWLLDAGLIRKLCDKMALFSAPAFHYYLPAFLLAALDTFVPKNEVLEFTIFNLSPTKTSKTDKWFSDRLARFTPDQKSVVRKFLNLILDDPSMYSFYKDAERGLNKFWT